MYGCVHIWVHEGQRTLSSVILYHSPPFERALFLNLKYFPMTGEREGGGKGRGEIELSAHVYTGACTYMEVRGQYKALSLPLSTLFF